MITLSLLLIIGGLIISTSPETSSIPTLEVFININTPAPGHYTPEPDSILQIEFNYPQSWGFLGGDYANFVYEDNGVWIEFTDPSNRFPCVTTEVKADGSVNTMVVLPCARGMVMQLRFRGIEDAGENVTDDRFVEIDGNPGRAITYQYHNSMYIDDELYGEKFFIQNNGHSYVFAITGLKLEDIGGNFHQAFRELIESIRFVVD